MTNQPNPKPKHSEVVRKRRLQQSKQRYEAVARASVLVRPLVSRPKPVTGLTSTLNRAKRPLFRWPTFRLNFGWRIFSATMFLALAGLLFYLFANPAMYITGINLGGSALVPGEEIYAATGLAQQHIFWVDPAAVRARILAVPGIAEATVQVEWPSTVTVWVTERVPVAIWRENNFGWWVDIEGQKFKARQELPGLLPIVVDDARSTMFNDTTPVSVAAIQGALQLRELRPNIELLHYDAAHGLSYQDGRGWRGYFGTGLNMPQKLAVYETLVDNLVSRQIQPELISVENLDAPYYRK